MSTLERAVDCSQFPLTKCHVTSDMHTGIQLLVGGSGIKSLPA